MNAVGGLGEAKEANNEIQSMIDHLKDEIKSQAHHKNIQHLKAINYRSQVVAGTNYYIKVHIGGDDHIHVKVFKPLPHQGDKPKLSSISFDKKKEDKIEFF